MAFLLLGVFGVGEVVECRDDARLFGDLCAIVRIASRSRVHEVNFT
jgi:hypothetical protein